MTVAKFILQELAEHKNAEKDMRLHDYRDNTFVRFLCVHDRACFLVFICQLFYVICHTVTTQLYDDIC